VEPKQYIHTASGTGYVPAGICGVHGVHGVHGVPLCGQGLAVSYNNAAVHLLSLSLYTGNSATVCPLWEQM
jgi:hypothetical protein